MLIILCGTQSAVNIGMILRSAEAFHVRPVFVDTFKTMENDDAVQTISDFACGAFERTPPEVWDDYAPLDSLPGRKIATTSGGRGRSTSGFVWRHDDILLIGNEYDGVPPLLEKRADLLLSIPMSQGHHPKPPSTVPIDKTRVTQIKNPSAPALNAAIAASILMSLAFDTKSGSA